MKCTWKWHRQWKDSEMFVEGSPVIARCPLGQSKNPSSEVFLTMGGIVVRHNGNKMEVFPREQIKQLVIRHRILWLPLVIGGIITPLALVALIKTFGAFWILLMVVLGGLFLMYYGYTGTDALTVSTTVKDYDFFVSSTSPYLKAFVQFAGAQLRNNDPFVYLAPGKDVSNEISQTGIVPEGTQIYLSRAEVPFGHKILGMNARENEIHLRFEINEPLTHAAAFLQKSIPAHLFQEVE
ncbi:hypothetical protein [Fulvivirga sedimenti]|uniref:Uncharacterized protein n=1 Tax=Fulvivirga sedimenti TaxID=2879465 RepID=A0A9X1HKE3_9BACT|nr:hypothetical protein [Fulvivirga sedimenti]MCA6073824.1 hypothetical protein [Fulvivirga sedimenti]